jgi:hypothetical protein
MITDPTPERPEPASRGWVTPLQMALLGIAALLCGLAATAYWPQSAAQAQGPGGFPGPPGPGGFGPQRERKILAQFDTDKNKRLDLEERKAARAWLATQPAFGPGGRRGGRGFGREAVTPTEGKRLSPADVKSFSNAPLYDPATLRTIFLQFEEPDWEQALADFKNTDVDVPATAVVDGKTYKDVGVHFRGMSSYMMVPEGAKRSLNLSFDFAHPDQALAGYRTLNLLNANGDPTFVRAVLFSEIARAYIPAPRINFVRTVINGESWGVYLNAQQFNKDFLRDNYDSEKGARWKVPGSPGGRGGMEYLGDDPADYERIYEIKTKDDPKAWADLIRLCKVLNETPPEKLEAALAPMLDIEATLKFLAVDVALVNSDGYWTRASDYSIYEDEKGRFHVIPHDMNEGLADEGGGFGGRGFGGPPRGMPPPPDGGFPGGRGFGGGRFGRGGPASAELDPLVGLNDSSKALRSRLLAVPALRARYMTYVRDVAEKWLDWKKLEPIVRARQALIAEDVKVDGRKLYSTQAFTADVSEGENSLRAFVEKRRAYLLK